MSRLWKRNRPAAEPDLVSQELMRESRDLRRHLADMTAVLAEQLAEHVDDLREYLARHDREGDRP